jgi:hypothetical protein
MIIKVKKCLNCGIAHEWDFEAPRLKEMRLIKKMTGLTGEAFGNSMVESDPDAITALIYILHLRDKIKVPFDDIDLDLNDFDMEETEAERKEREALEAAAKGKAEDDELLSGPTPEAD